jgi:hypothetical protein
MEYETGVLGISSWNGKDLGVALHGENALRQTLPLRLVVHLSNRMQMD